MSDVGSIRSEVWGTRPHYESKFDGKIAGETPALPHKIKFKPARPKGGLLQRQFKSKVKGTQQFAHLKVAATLR